ncbi:hypothetical protein ACN082_05835 [Rothia sp. CCM 9417]|uniref:hypothetical protein n=1 Tax=Rothia sp. CCM 9417 TaxID=3402657 RepID=UPI003AE8EBD9
MKNKEKMLSRLGFIVLAPTVVWYIYLLFTGTETPLQTFVTVVSLTSLFALSFFLFAFGENVKMAIVSAVLAVFAVPFAFLVASVLGAQSGIY